MTIEIGNDAFARSDHLSKFHFDNAARFLFSLLFSSSSTDAYTHTHTS